MDAAMTEVGEVNITDSEQKEAISSNFDCQSQDEDETVYSRIESDSIFDPKCGGGCKKRLTKHLKSRKCSMCGELFCHQCTVYRCKLSQTFPTTKHSKLVPDDILGTLHRVCQKCFKSESEVSIGSFRDLMRDFAIFRQQKFEVEEAKAREDILCCSNYTYSAFKRRAIVKEIDRLLKGFAENPGLLKELASEMKTPNWQKSANWIDSRNANHCYHCKKPLKLLKKKNNCVIGGQVFCTKCSEDEMVVYLEKKHGEPKWGINGKFGVKTTDLARHGMYKICTICSDDLHAIYLANVTFESWQQTNTFMDCVCRIQRSIVELQEKVEKWLPDYLQAVEVLDGDDISNMSYEDRKRLAKLHFDTTDAQSAGKDRYCDLQKIQPQTTTEEQLIRSVKRGIQMCFQEHKCQIDYTHELLSEDVIKELHEVQKVSSQKSMEQIYVDVIQMVEDVSEHTDIDGSILKDAGKILLSIEEDFLNEDTWRKDHKAMLRIRREPFRIEVSHNVMTLERMIASHCSTVAKKCISHLEANTLEQEFKKTKSSLTDTWMKYASFSNQKM